MKVLSIFNLNNFQATRLLMFMVSLVLGLTESVPPILANCNDRVASLELVQPIMERLWSTLKAKNSVYGQLKNNSITLTEAFNSLNSLEKKQVLDALKLGYNNNWFELLTPSQQKDALEDPGLGAISPYQVYSSDGRLISVAYDGCTRLTLLTEKERFSYYYHVLVYRNSLGERQTSITPQMLRNAGQPSWRNVNVSIAQQKEKQIRLHFWQTIGYDRVDEGWWIAWVPEQGHFEINVPLNYDKKPLQAYLKVASPNYQYIIINNQGTQIP